jgi:phage baseplate assembly protein W
VAREFLGIGWSFPVKLDADGRVAQAQEEAKIHQAIELILRTATGERTMRPDFGCGIHDLIFDAVSDDLLGRVLGEVSSALARWEPRIDVLDVQAQPDRDDPIRLLIQIDYRVRSTNSRFNLVFPFYVQ